MSIHFNKWFIDIISPHNDMKDHLQRLLADFPMIDIQAMGFQPDGKKSLCGNNRWLSLKSTIGQADVCFLQTGDSYKSYYGLHRIK